MSLRILLPAALLLLLALAPPAAACTVEPPTVCHVDTDLAGVCVQGPCPPATNGGIHVRLGDKVVSVPFPG